MGNVLNLHKLVRETADEFPETADPGVLADKVFGLIEPSQYATALRTMLRSYVRKVMTEDRAFRIPAPPAGTVPQQPKGKQPAPRSGYMEAMRAGAWRSRLAERTHGADGWLLLRDCTRDDLEAAASERRGLAVANAKAATTYDTLASLLTAHAVAVVGSLPESALAEALAD